MIVVLGNSHVVSFVGSPPCGTKIPGRINQRNVQHNVDHPEIMAVFLGRGLVAYNFKENHLPKILQVIAERNLSKANDTLLLHIGEVDCRYFLAKRILEGGDQDVVVNECVDRFFETVKCLVADGWKVALVGAHPSTTEGHSEHPDKPHFGDCAFRNSVCMTWNAALETKCVAMKLPFVSIFKHLVDLNNITDMSYFVDYCHLSYDKCFPLYLAEMRAVGLMP